MIAAAVLAVMLAAAGAAAALPAEPEPAEADAPFDQDFADGCYARFTPLAENIVLNPPVFTTSENWGRIMRVDYRAAAAKDGQPNQSYRFICANRQGDESWTTENTQTDWDGSLPRF